MEPFVEFIKVFGVPGVLVWYLWYDTAVSRPKRDEAAAAQIERLVGHYNGIIDRIAADFTQTIREERQARREEIQMLRDDMRGRLGLSDTVGRDSVDRGTS